MAAWDDSTKTVKVITEEGTKGIRRAYLIVLAGQSVGEMFELKPRVSFGRDNHDRPGRHALASSKGGLLAPGAAGEGVGPRTARRLPPSRPGLDGRGSGDIAGGDFSPATVAGPRRLLTGLPCSSERVLRKHRYRTGPVESTRACGRRAGAAARGRGPATESREVPGPCAPAAFV